MKTNHRLSILIPLLFSLISCHPTTAPNSQLNQQSVGIINGTPVAKTDLPYQMTARILTEAQGVWYPDCTASIVGNDLILTAAHCVEYEQVGTLRIGFDIQPLTYAGQRDPKTRVDVVAKFKTNEVDGFVVHPGYGKSDYDQDMALIRIKGQIPKGFVAAQLLSDKQLASINDKQEYNVTLAGYGLLSEQPNKESEILRKTTVPAHFEGSHLVTDQTKGSGGCNGDSGGPAYLQVDGKLFLVGVTHGPLVDEQDCHHHGVWGNPNFEKEFLNQSAEKLGSPVRF